MSFEPTEVPYKTTDVSTTNLSGSNTSSISGESTELLANTNINAEVTDPTLAVLEPTTASNITIAAIDSAIDTLVISETPNVGTVAIDNVNNVEVATPKAVNVPTVAVTDAVEVKEYPLHQHQQITIPTFAGNPSKEITNITLTSSDTTIATVDANGLVTRVFGTDGINVSVYFNGQIIDEFGDVVPVYGVVRYSVVHIAPITIELLSTEI